MIKKIIQSGDLFVAIYSSRFRIKRSEIFFFWIKKNQVWFKGNVTKIEGRNGDGLCHWLETGPWSLLIFFFWSITHGWRVSTSEREFLGNVCRTRERKKDNLSLSSPLLSGSHMLIHARKTVSYKRHLPHTHKHNEISGSSFVEFRNLCPTTSFFRSFYYMGSENAHVNNSYTNILILIWIHDKFHI